MRALRRDHEGGHGDIASAIIFLTRATRSGLRLRGPDHPDTLTSRNSLASTYASADDPGRAIPLYEATLADRERVLGSDHPDTLITRQNLAGSYQAVGDLGRAVPLYQATFTASERVRGTDHSTTKLLREKLKTATDS